MNKLIAITTVFILAVLLAGCGALLGSSVADQENEQIPAARQPVEPPQEQGNADRETEQTPAPLQPIEPPQEHSIIAILYFGDSEAMGFNAEERLVDAVTPQILINELIKGPKIEQNMQTIPDGTRLLDIKVENGVAYVNFSKEIVENHWGGSTGEIMTVESIVNTLALNEELGIEKVQILIEGEIVETLAGHLIISTPLKPSPGMINPNP